MDGSHSFEESLFTAALSLPPEKREAFLLHACDGDQVRVKRILELIAAHEACPPTPVPPRTLMRAAAVDGEEAAGDTIDRYTLLHRVGEGGWGVVWLAQQREPVSRQVALKVIKLGMDTKAVIARFEAERQALALMDHPNIARVLDGGATRGRPYFVMDLVRGPRITEYCDQVKASTRERLELFIQICDAVDHAHRKGIIHRDLKPSNLLVSVPNRLPVPKVIDFGISKSMHGPTADAALVTGVEQFIGTPAYMSPEQAEMSGLTELDGRTDIYSLGVVLYELMVGRPPFDPETLAHSSLDEIRKIIREVDPSRPSTLLAALTREEFSAVAKLRSTLPMQLSQALRGDLDWIIMRSLEKDRNRRYDTAAAFAADVRRYLDHQPVAARPPTTMYRIQKFARRHKTGVTAAAVIALALLIATGVSTWQAVVASRERTEATRSYERAEKLLLFQLGELRTQLEKVGRLDVLEAVYDEAMKYFSSLHPEKLTDTTLMLHARALTLIGEIRTRQLRYDEAATAFATAFARAEALVSRNPKHARALFERGQAEFFIGELNRRRGSRTEAAAWLTRYRDTSLALVALEPGNIEWQAEVVMGWHNLAVLKRDAGDLEGARADFTAKLDALHRSAAAQSRDLKLKHRITDTQSWLGLIAEQQGDFRNALEWYQAKAQGLQELQAADPNDRTWSYYRAESLSLQARVLANFNRLREARTCLAEARELIDRVTRHDPANRLWEKTSHIIRLREATLCRAENKLEDAVRLARMAREGFLASQPPRTGQSDYNRDLAVAYRVEAEICLDAGLPDAKDKIDAALRAGEAMLRSATPSDEEISQMASVLMTAARIDDQAGRHDLAAAGAQRAWDLLQPRIGNSNDWRILDPAARALQRLGQSNEFELLKSRIDRMGYVPPSGWRTSAFPKRQE